MPIRRPPTDEEIAARAREIYEQQGRVEGRAREYWLQAKAELEAAEASAESEEIHEAGDEPAAHPKR
jgi:hypothetical protein